MTTALSPAAAPRQLTLDDLLGSLLEPHEETTPNIAGIVERANRIVGSNIDRFLRGGNILLDLLTHEVYVLSKAEQKKADLSPTEFRLLEYLMEHSGIVVSKDEILKNVFGSQFFSDGNIRPYINSLRNKIGAEHIETVRRFDSQRTGYKYIDQSTDEASGVFLGTKGNLTLYLSSRVVYVWDEGKQKEAGLTPTEFRLLEYLMEHSGVVVSKDEICQNVFGSEFFSDENIKWHIKNLRSKIGDKHIESFYGLDYKCIVPNSNTSIDKTRELLLFDGLLFDVDGHVLYNKDGEKTHLSPTEYICLSKMAENPGRVVTKEQLELSLHPPIPEKGKYNVLKFFIHNLRKKLGDDPHKPMYIKTVRGGGYEFIAPLKTVQMHSNGQLVLF